MKFNVGDVYAVKDEMANAPIGDVLFSYNWAPVCFTQGGVFLVVDVEVNDEGDFFVIELVSLTEIYRFKLRGNVRDFAAACELIPKEYPSLPSDGRVAA